MKLCLDCRPFIPPLHLVDAGLSYGPPNCVVPSYMSLDSLSCSELEQMADLPVNHEYYKKRGTFAVKDTAPKGRRHAADMSPLKLKREKSVWAALTAIPSYRNVSHCIHKTTVSFEVFRLPFFLLMKQIG